MIKFVPDSEDEIRLISRIARRGSALAASNGFEYRLFDVDMDISVCHLNGCPLDLGALLSANTSDFAHDLFGILHHIDRKTGELKDCFIPRFAVSNNPRKEVPA